MSIFLDRLLADCRFAPNKGHWLPDGESYFLPIEGETDWVEPSFNLAVSDTTDLECRFGLDASHLEVGLTLRVPHLRRYEVLGRWRLDELPNDPWAPAPHRLQSFKTERDVDFIVLIRVRHSNNHSRSLGLVKGSVLSRKVFQVREQTVDFAFPVQWSQFGDDTGYPDSMLWAIKWHDPESEETLLGPVHEALTVYVNARAESPLNAISELPSSTDLAWRMLASDITTQIWTHVLTKSAITPDINDRDSLLGQVYSRLSDLSGLSYSDIQELAESEADPNELRSYVSRIIEVVH